MPTQWLLKALLYYLPLSTIRADTYPRDKMITGMKNGNTSISPSLSRTLMDGKEDEEKRHESR